FHMASLLLDGLDRLKIEYRFQSGREAYKSGLLNHQVKRILENSKLVGSKIKELLGQEKFEEVLPYYPVCKRCGRIYLAEGYEYLPKEEKVLYRCKGAKLGGRQLDGCGYEGEAKIVDGEGKLSWKGEFAARWSALDIRFEAYGKDIADSVRVNDWISDEILHHPHPYHVRYELFLDKSGRKISKSLGNVFTPQLWLRYGSPQSLLLLMYKRIVGTRNLSPTDIPNYMDEYDFIEDVYFGRLRIENPSTLRKLKGLYEYIHHLKPPPAPSVHVPYRMLVQLASVAPKEDLVNFVTKKLIIYGIVQKASPELEERIRMAANWSEDFVTVERPAITLSDQEKKAIAELIDVLKAETDGRSIQNKIFSIAKENGLEVASFFKTLYRIVLGVDKGPKLGPYMVDVGREKIVQLLYDYIK
ncbi:MAG: lysine--tRNA ligase, partial [Nitrososphaerota archaeon]